MEHHFSGPATERDKPYIPFWKQISETMKRFGTQTFSNDRPNVDVKSCTEVVPLMNGLIALSASPFYGLTIDVGSEEEAEVLPLTLVDAGSHLCEWIRVVGKRVVIHEPLVVFEVFYVTKENKKEPEISVVAQWENIEIVPGIKAVATTRLSTSPRLSRILVHHVSMPFHIGGPPAFCLVYVILLNSTHSGSRHQWMVLRAEQVAWREFLIPNREYLIELPPESDDSVLKKSLKPLHVIFPKLNRELKVILHHKELFHTLSGFELPKGCKIHLTSNSDLSKLCVAFTKDPFNSWFCAREAENANVELVTFYGQIETVIYSKDIELKSCYLCINGSPKEPKLLESQSSDFKPWTNPWQTTLTMENDESLELPCIDDKRGTVMETGVPGNMVQIIKLKDIETESEHSVYVKHTYLPNTLRLFRLAQGMVLCVTHLNRRKSAAGNYYYISTVLSSFRVLSYNFKGNSREGWGSYGFHSGFSTPQLKIWGVVESLNIAKVSISVKCTNCKGVVYKHACPRACPNVQPSKDFIASAYALAWIQISNGGESMSLERVLIKDNFVKTLLCMSDEGWQLHLKAAAAVELIYVSGRRPNPVKTTCVETAVSYLFYQYCSLVSKPSGRFYISVRKMSSLSDDEPFYYCLHMEPMNSKRLNTVAWIVKNCLTT